MTEQKLKGYPSIDKPWLKYYSKETQNARMPECTIYTYLWENNKKNLEDVAICYYGKKITYGKLFKKIDKVSKGFYHLGVKPSDVIIMASVTTPEMIYTFYALNRLGAVLNMVDPRTSVDRIQEYIREANVKIVLSIDAAYQKIEQAAAGTSVRNIIVLSPLDSLPTIKKVPLRITNKLKGNSPELKDGSIIWKQFIEGGDKEIHEAPYVKNACCAIIHTGGTTGTPKGVMLSNENINSSVVQGNVSGFNFQRRHKWLNIMPPFIAYGIVNGLHMPLCDGMTLVVLPQFDPKKYDKLLLKYKPNHIAGVPSHYNTVIHSKKLAHKDLSFLLSPIVGGDGTEVGFEKQVNDFLNEHNCQANLIKGYGMTEVCACVSVAAQKRCNKLGSVGIPLSHSQVSVFENGKELPYGNKGEICMRGPSVMIGYYKNEKETSTILQKHEDGSVWVHSGDLGYIDEDGCVFIEGRLKRMIVRADGFKVFPKLIEDIVLTHENVKACCVVGAPDKEHSQGELPVAFIVLVSEFLDKEAEILKALQKLCFDNLPEYAQPIGFRFCEVLPLTAIGKIDFCTLKRIAAEI